jgi:hypothetical protein
MESTERDASAPMGLWEFASHIHTTTVTDTTTVRLVVPTDLTERGASDHMGLRSSADHISGKRQEAVASRSRSEKDLAVDRREDVDFSRCGDQLEHDPAAAQHRCRRMIGMGAIGLEKSPP